jgi:hypothetical protein
MITFAGSIRPARRVTSRVFSGRARHDLSGAGAAGEEDEVEWKLKEFRGFFAVTRHRLFLGGHLSFRPSPSWDAEQTPAWYRLPTAGVRSKKPPNRSSAQ